ncbi:MAG: radical SAM protein [Alphaproteobacteria bacterium]|nr:radical SAM protein [Alphaproteobacteria bacterium]
MSQNLAPRPSRLDPRKFRDPDVTAKGERRARVALKGLQTLWFNTGTLCNLTCRNCYIESSPRNDSLVYLTAGEVAGYLDEIQRDGWPTHEIGFTGGEPFMNPELIAMLDDCLGRGFRALVLTNAMKPMWKQRAGLAELAKRYGERLALRVSVDHFSQALHELERGRNSWRPTMDGLAWLVAHGVTVHIAGRTCWGESQADARKGYARLFAERNIPIDAFDERQLVLFPEMDATADVPEITEACWGILKKSPDAMMCATARMVVKRKGADRPAVLACTLLPYDPQFELGATLAEAAGVVRLNHPHCAKFCVLGGGSCSKGG